MKIGQDMNGVIDIIQSALYKVKKDRDMEWKEYLLNMNDNDYWVGEDNVFENDNDSVCVIWQCNMTM